VKKTIGIYPEMTLEEARKKVSRMNRIKMAGQNPADPNCEVTEYMTLGELFNRYLEIHAKPHRKSWKQDVGIYDCHLRHWKDREIGSLTPSELQAFHARLGTENGKQVANRARAILYTLYEKATEWGYERSNPVAKVKPFRKSQRDRFLQPEELPRFFKVLLNRSKRGERFDEDFQDYILLLLFTGARKIKHVRARFALRDLCPTPSVSFPARSGCALRPLRLNAVQSHIVERNH